MICAETMYANVSWTFGLCLLSEQSRIPSNAQSCAQKASIDYNALHSCAYGPKGDVAFTFLFPNNTATYDGNVTPFHFQE